MARSLLLLLVFGLLSSLRADAEPLPSPRAPRLLRLIDATGTPLKGDCVEPRFEARGKGVFFQRSGQNMRELWFAVPQTHTNERYPAWRAAPILRPREPLRLSEAVSLRDDNTVFVALGTTGTVPDTQILLVSAQKAALLQSLWKGRERMSQLALSPDTKTVVFTRYFRDMRGRETPQLWRIPSDASESKPTLILKSARRAFWLDSNTLIFERVLESGTAFYSLNPFAAQPPRLLMQGSGEGAALGGAGLVFSARSGSTPLTSLYLLARDGSGLRSIENTDGARHPNVSRDGTKLTYDAPDPSTGARSIWLLSLDSAAPATANPAALQMSAPLSVNPVAYQLDPFPLPPPASPPDGGPVPDTPPAAKPTPFPTPTSAPKPTPTPTKAPPSPGDDHADIDVAGTLATVPPGGKMHVTLWAKNRGKRNWNSDDVRIVIRWIDFDSGMRRRWSFNWMKGVVPPLGQVRIPMDIVAPTRKGRYKLIYGLVRLPSKGAGYNPPPFDSPQESWPGEFAATAFAVNVSSPPSAPN